jgi:hypothetical protein
MESIITEKSRFQADREVFRIPLHNPIPTISPCYTPCLVFFPEMLLTDSWVLELEGRGI